MPQITLTDVSIKSLKLPTKGQTAYLDKSLKGFGVRVSQGGTKTFFVMHGATRQRVTIGRYPVITLAEARNEAKRRLAEHTLGMHRPTRISWQEGVKLFLAASAQKNKPRTTHDYESLLNRNFKLSRASLADITQHDLMSRIIKLKDTPSEQNHAFVAVRVFLRWAVKNHYIDRSPLEGQSLPSKIVSRSRVLNSQELVQVYNRAADYGYVYGSIIQLLILTGQRRGEIGALRWDWIDRDEDTITLPAALTKNGIEHTFPYGPLTKSIIEALPEISEYVFPAARSHVRGKPTTSFNGWAKSKPTFDIGLQLQPFTLHDIRRTYSTIMASLDVPIHVTEKLLNHISGQISGIAGIYNRHTYMPEMRKAVETYEAYVSTLILT